MTYNIAVLSAIPRLSHHLRLQLPSVNISDVSANGNDVHAKLNGADIVVADCDLLLPYATKLPSVKWVQSTWAGIDKFASKVPRDEPINYTLTRFSDNAFGFAISEYVIAQIVNFERDQRKQFENQQNRTWSQLGRISDYRLISDLSVGILGLGNIGKSIARTLKSFGASVWGLSRTPLKQKLDYLDQHRVIDDLPEILRNCDYLVNALPSTTITCGLLNGNALENCKDRGTVFLNVGRGSIIKEADLINALERKWISGAILDVFEEEPLPEHSPLWNLSQVTISPHISGVSRAQDIARFFAENYQKFIRGDELSNVFNWQEGY